MMAAELENIKGELPALIKTMLYQLFSQGSFNFATSGMHVEAIGGQWHLRAEFGVFGVDERAGKFGHGVKGASGTKCCMFCKNVTNTFSNVVDDYFCHFTEHRRSRWDLHDDASFLEAKELLDAAHRNGEDINRLQQNLGLLRDEDGLLWDAHIASIVKPPYSMYWDALHCEFASGGNAQYLVNGFALEAFRNDITAEDLDGFTKECKGVTLPNKCWQSRIVHKPRKHFRGLGSEAIDAVAVLSLFCDAVVTPAGKMQAHVRAVKLMSDMINILQRTGDMMLNVDKLDELQEGYQELHQRLYGSKPKNHYTRHVVDCIRRWKKNFLRARHLRDTIRGPMRLPPIVSKKIMSPC